MPRRKRESSDEVGDGSATGECGAFRVGGKDLGFTFIHWTASEGSLHTRLCKGAGHTVAMEKALCLCSCRADRRLIGISWG